MFVPKHKRKDGLLTRGDLVDKLTLVPHFGYYFETSDGRKFTGKNPYDGPTTELVDAPEEVYNELTGTTARASKDLYDTLTQDKESYRLKITQALENYYPTKIPNTPSFKRYFARDKRSGKIYEINVNVYKALKTQQPTYYHPAYTILELEWALQGSIEDSILGRFVAPGVRTINTNTILAAETKLPGIKIYLVDPLQFVK